MVDWITPLSGQPFGPGFKLQFLPTTVGSPPPDSFVVVQLVDANNEDRPCLFYSFPFSGFPVNVVAGIRPNDNSYVRPDVWASLAQGGDALLTVSVQSSSGTFDTGTQAVKIDYQSGLATIESFLSASSAGQGLTEEQAVQLAETHQSVLADLGDAVTHILTPIADLIQHPRPQIGHLTAETCGLFGDGSLPLPPQLNLAVSAWVWRFESYPAGIGQTPGGVVEFQRRMVQWRVIHEINGVEVVTQLLDVNYDRVLTFFAESFPVRLEYSILPGVELCVRFWVWP